MGFRSANLGLIERYNRNQLALHVHGAAQDVLPTNRHRTGRWEFCALIQHGADGSGGHSAGNCKCVMYVDADDDHIQIAVLVDVREYSEISQHVVRIIPSVVRLQS